jgi:predicted permease
VANRIFAVLLAVVGGLLLIASANLGGLLLARGAARKGEMAVRLAIGASGGRLVRQLVMETVWIALLGSVAAFLLTFWTANLVKPLIPYDVAVTYTPDLRVLLFALVVGVMTSAVFGLAPAWNAARTDLITLIRSDAAGVRGDRGRVRWALAVGQFAVSFVLLASTGLLVRSVQRMNAVDPGFRTEDVLVGNLELGTAGTQGPNASGQVATIVKRISAMPGVLEVARASAVPAAGAMATRGMWRPDAFDGSALPPSVRYMTIDPAYLPTMGVRLAGGRNFASADSNASAPVMIINETLARLLFPNGDAVGRQLAYATLDGPRVTEVVGVAADTKNRSLREPPGPQAYVPVAQDPRGRVLLHVRTSTPTAAFASRLSATVREAVPGVPAVSFTTVRDRLGSSLADMRLIASLGGLFSVLALVLAVSGLYGVIAYGAARRRREFGVRLALGASPWQVAQLVGRQTFKLVSVALVVGVSGALGTGRLLRSQLFGVTAYDPVTFVAMAAVLCIAAVCAALVPAYSAARTDPMGSLRQ